MFSKAHWQIKLVYAGFGGLLMFIGMVFSPVSVFRDRFGDIECSSLTVVDNDERIALSIDAGEFGGRLYAYGKDGKSAVYIAAREPGGTVYTSGNDGKSGVYLGFINGRGAVVTQDENEKPVTQLYATDYGGAVTILGKDLQSQGTLGVNQDGAYLKVKENDYVSIWDK